MFSRLKSRLVQSFSQIGLVVCLVKDDKENDGRNVKKRSSWTRCNDSDGNISLRSQEDDSVGKPSRRKSDL